MSSPLPEAMKLFIGKKIEQIFRHGQIMRDPVLATVKTTRNTALTAENLWKVILGYPKTVLNLLRQNVGSRRD